MRLPASAKLAIGAALLAAGFGILADGAPTRGPLAQAAAGLFDLKDRQCRHAPTAVGSACPRGCEARPLASSEDRAKPTECRSPLWIATCGKACAPSLGFARQPGVGLVDGTRLLVTLRSEPDASLREALGKMGVSLTARFDGLDRYDAEVPPGRISEIKKRLSALPQVASADFVRR